MSSVALEPSSEQAPSSRNAEVVRRAFSAAAVASWGGVVLIFLLSLEAACRVEDWVAYRMPIASRYSSLMELLVRDADGMHARAGARFQKWIMNDVGTRGPAASILPQPGTLRIVTAGASETFGLREAPGKEYPRQLEDSLTAELARRHCVTGSPGRVEVLNAAFAGMGIPTIEQDVRTRLRRLHPDVVVVYPSPEMYLKDEPPTAARADSSSPHEPPFREALRPRVADRLRDQLKLLLPNFVANFARESRISAITRLHPTDWRFSTVPQDRLAQYDRDLRVLVRSIRSIGAIPVLATHGNLFMGRRRADPLMLTAWEQFSPRATGRIIVAFDSLARGVTLRVGADSGVVTVDAAAALARSPATVFADYAHFTDSGAAQMAHVLSAGVWSAIQACGGPESASTCVAPCGGS